jgi:adenylate kinase family enzyme
MLEVPAMELRQRLLSRGRLDDVDTGALRQRLKDWVDEAPDLKGFYDRQSKGVVVDANRPMDEVVSDMEGKVMRKVQRDERLDALIEASRKLTTRSSAPSVQI